MLRCAGDAGGDGFAVHDDGDRLRDALTLSCLFLDNLRFGLRSSISSCLSSLLISFILRLNAALRHFLSWCRDLHTLRLLWVLAPSSSLDVMSKSRKSLYSLMASLSFASRRCGISILEMSYM